MKNVIHANNIITNSMEDSMTLLTAKELAEMLMVGKNRVYELLNQNKIKGMPPVKYREASMCCA